VSADDEVRRGMHSRRTACIATFLLAPLSLAGAHRTASQPAAANAFELPVPRPLQPFELIDHRGAPFVRRNLEGRWTLLLFGYTQCADVCPTTLVDLMEARRRLAREHARIDSAAVLVSVDPARDTQPRLAEYVGRFGDGLVGVRSAPAALRAFAEQFRVRYAVASGAAAAGGGYAIDHTASVALLDPDAALHTVYPLPLRPPQLAADIARLAARRRGRANGIRGSAAPGAASEGGKP
jgi:protein SCO1